ncbi:MAG TPA: hypothetical protein VGD40_07965 [Chryseosolibacter sp.]
MSRVKSLIFVLISLFSAAQAWGQAARSPFTSAGIGEPYGNALINTQGMAGVGVSQPQYWYMNNQNPALLIYNTYTVFQAGILAESRTIRQDTASEKSVGGNLNYLVTAFPVKYNRWTTGVGLMPYSTVKYKISYLGDIRNSTDSIQVIEEGSGGLSQLYWSNGIRLFKGLAVGLKAAYIFGSTKNKYSNRLVRFDQPLAYTSTVEDKLYVQDLSFTAGVAYTMDSLFSRKRYRLSFGATTAFGTNLNSRLRSELYRSTNNVNSVDADTLFSLRGQTYVPPAFTGGISLSRGTKWSIGAEMSYQDWTSFKSINQDVETLGKSMRFAVGGELTPDLLSEKFLKRLIYRAGVSYEQYPYKANNKSVNDLGINFGLSVPAGRSSLDLAFRYGTRGSLTDNGLQEDYFKIFFGITFNDQWFIKRRFE